MYYLAFGFLSLCLGNNSVSQGHTCTPHKKSLQCKHNLKRRLQFHVHTCLRVQWHILVRTLDHKTQHACAFGHPRELAIMATLPQVPARESKLELITALEKGSRYRGRWGTSCGGHGRLRKAFCGGRLKRDAPFIFFSRDVSDDGRSLWKKKVGNY